MDIRESVKKMLVGEAAEITADVLASFDPSGLIKKVKELTGVEVTVTLGKGGRHNEDRIKISSPNVVDKCGILSIVLREVTIDDFGSAITAKGDKLVAWVSVHFSYESLRGGGNGQELMDAWYDFNAKTWKFETVVDRYKKEGSTE